MAVSGIQGKLLEITVVGCSKLKDNEWISRHYPYVCLEYATAGTKFRTRTCADGGKNPTFQEKFVFTFIEGLPEIIVSVFNENNISYDDLTGSGKIQLQKVLSTGYDNSSWPLQTKTGRQAGEVHLIMHYSNANKPATNHAQSAPPYGAGAVSHSPDPPYPYTPPSQSAYALPPSRGYPSPYPYQPQPPPAYSQAAHLPLPHPSPPYPPRPTYPPWPYPAPPHSVTPHYPPPRPYGMYPPPH